MNVRLSDSTQAHVRVIRKYFAGLVPVSLDLSTAEVVRLAVRKLAEQVAASDEHLAREVAALCTDSDSRYEAPGEGPRALRGEARERRYNAFFSALIPKLAARGFDRQGRPPSRSWYNFAAGHGLRRWVEYGCSFNRHGKARVELYLGSDQASNEALFDSLYGERASIEAEFGEALQWERLDHKKACRVAVLQRNGAIDDDDATLEDLQDWMVNKLWRLDRALGPRLEAYPPHSRSRG